MNDLNGKLVVAKTKKKTRKKMRKKNARRSK